MNLFLKGQPLRIFTLSFGEYLMFKAKYAAVGNPKTELKNYVRLGGFPATHLQAYSQDEIYTIVRDIYNSTIFSDIVKRNQNRKIDQLERVVKYTFNVGQCVLARIKKTHGLQFTVPCAFTNASYRCIVIIDIKLFL